MVCHQAAIRITQCAEEPRLALEVLVDGTFNVLEAAAAAKVSKVVAASSASVYGLAEQFPTDERHHHHNNDTFYGAAKSFNQGMLRSFRAMYGLDYVGLLPFNVYGPRMDVHGVYTEVLVRWMERIADGQPPLIFGDGRQTMDFVYTEDIARANVLAIESDVVEGFYNVASGVETSLLDLARALLRAMDSDLDVEFGPERPVNGVTRRLADTSAAARDLGFEAKVSLEDGLAATGRVVAHGEGGTLREPHQCHEAVARQPRRSPRLTEAIESGWVAQGPRVAAFEAKFAANGWAPSTRSPCPVARPRCTWRWSSRRSARVMT